MSSFFVLHHLLLHLDNALELSWSNSLLWSLTSLVTVLACMVMSLAFCKVMLAGFLTRKALSLSMTLAACSNRSSASFLCPLLSLLAPLAFVKLSSQLLAAPWHKSLAFLALFLASSHGSFSFFCCHHQILFFIIIIHSAIFNGQLSFAPAFFSFCLSIALF